eukprot:scaffold8_cov249-Pinguiococcus_pyrenoidosus.AAC.21
MGAKHCCCVSPSAATVPPNAVGGQLEDPSKDVPIHEAARLVECSSAAEAAIRDRLFELPSSRVADKRRQLSPEYDAVFDHLAEMGLLESGQKRGMASLVSKQKALEKKIAKMDTIIEGMQQNERMPEEKKAERLEDLRGKQELLAEQLKEVKAAGERIQQLCPSIYGCGLEMKHAGRALELQLVDPIRRWAAAEFRGSDVEVVYNAELRSQVRKPWQMEYDGIVVGQGNRRLVATIEIKLARADAVKSVGKRVAAAAEAQKDAGAFYFIDEQKKKMDVAVSSDGLRKIYAFVLRQDRHANLDSGLFHGMQDEALAVAALYESARTEEARDRGSKLQSLISQNCPSDGEDFTVDGATVVFIDDLLSSFSE